MDNKNYYTPDLQLFSGEAQGGVNGETGDSIADAGQNETKNSVNEFDELINGKYKNEFTKKTQAIIDKRFRQTKELEDYKAKVDPAIEALMKKYGINPGEEDRLSELINSDNSEEKEALPNKKDKDGIKNRIKGWISESLDLKEKIPDFDLRRELRENKDFSRFLMSGMSLKTAYEAAHRDEILSDAVSLTAQRVREQVVSGIQAKGMRPVENGVSSDSAIVTSVDVNSLTSQDILKILKQVENGANVRF